MCTKAHRGQTLCRMLCFLAGSLFSHRGDAWLQQLLAHLQVSTFCRRATSLRAFCSMPCFFWGRLPSPWFLVLCLMTSVLKSRYGPGTWCIPSLLKGFFAHSPPPPSAISVCCAVCHGQLQGLSMGMQSVHCACKLLCHSHLAGYLTAHKSFVHKLLCASASILQWNKSIARLRIFLVESSLAIQ